MSFFKPIISLVFPIECVSCRAPGQWLCERCLDRIDPWLTPNCPGCGRPSRTQTSCPRCLEDPLSGVLVAAPYPDRIIQKAIRMLKYHFARELAGELSKLLVRELEAAVELDRGWTGFNAIVPVPLHVARLKYRGFNQSEALGQGVSRRFGWPLRSELLVRHRFTPPQAKLEETQRRKNLQKAFIVPDTAVVAGLRLLLIDDVTTTGTTLKAAAEALKEAGATEIRAVVLASG